MATGQAWALRFVWMLAMVISGDLFGKPRGHSSRFVLKPKPLRLTGHSIS